MHCTSVLSLTSTTLGCSLRLMKVYKSFPLQIRGEKEATSESHFSVLSHLCTFEGQFGFCPLILSQKPLLSFAVRSPSSEPPTSLFFLRDSFKNLCFGLFWYEVPNINASRWKLDTKEHMEQTTLYITCKTRGQLCTSNKIWLNKNLTKQNDSLIMYISKIK